DTARADTSHLAFGHGIHHCLGARLARLEGLMALTALHGRFPAMRLAVPRSALRWSHGDGLVLRGLSELPVVLGPPSPAYYTHSKCSVPVDCCYAREVPAARHRTHPAPPPARAGQHRPRGPGGHPGRGGDLSPGRRGGRVP